MTLSSNNVDVWVRTRKTKYVGDDEHSLGQERKQTKVNKNKSKDRKRLTAFESFEIKRESVAWFSWNPIGPFFFCFWK